MLGAAHYTSIKAEIWIPTSPTASFLPSPAPSPIRRARACCACFWTVARAPPPKLAAAAEIGASTASSHFQRLRDQGLVEQAAQGKHRYYRLANGEVARALEALLVVAGAERTPFKPSTPSALREARTCYVSHGRHPGGAHARRDADAPVAGGRRQDYALTPLGEASLAQIGVDAAEARAAVAASPAPAWTGASAVRTWAARWARPCWTR